jgi:hypothetical protein
MSQLHCPNCTSEDLKAYELETAATDDGRSVIGCAYCIEDGRIVRGEEAPAAEDDLSYEESF